MINIGRPGPFGNPFRVGADGTRVEVVEKFRQWLGKNEDIRAQWIREHIYLLKNQELYCPGCRGTSPCHGDVLKEYL